MTPNQACTTLRENNHNQFLYLFFLGANHSQVHKFNSLRQIKHKMKKVLLRKIAIAKERAQTILKTLQPNWCAVRNKTECLVKILLNQK